MLLIHDLSCVEFRKANQLRFFSDDDPRYVSGLGSEDSSRSTGLYSTKDGFLEGSTFEVPSTLCQVI